MKKLPLLLLIVLLGCHEDFSNDSASPGGSESGQGGSMARFAIQGDHLYTVDRTSLNVFDIQDAAHPAQVNIAEIGTQIETIFPREDHLFIGSQSGMHIYDITDPQRPAWKSTFEHIVSCDPVVADDRYAYVTLRSIETVCGRFTDQLDIVDIDDLTNPTLVASYDMVHPKGLGVDGKELFVCDAGLKVFDITNVDSLKLKYHFRIEANDVIPYNDYLMVIGDNGLYQYSYGDTIEYVSRLPFVPVP